MAAISWSQQDSGWRSEVQAQVPAVLCVPRLVKATGQPCPVIDHRGLPNRPAQHPKVKHSCRQVLDARTFQRGASQLQC